VRDPRKDPQAGDITTFSAEGATSIYHVTKRDGRLVHYLQTTNGTTEHLDTYIEDWIDGSQEDEVLHVAES
jgi:predicted methyltransferase